MAIEIGDPMTNIVEKLREAGDTQDGNWAIYDQAADEIERLHREIALRAEEEARLRAENDRLQAFVSRQNWSILDVIKERDAAVALLREARVSLDDAGSGREWEAFLDKIDDFFGVGEL